MDKTATPLYEEWVVTLPPMPQPSTLYPLDPIGIGTPFVESMTSYIARLAEAHCVFPGVLMRKVIAPFAESHLMGAGGSTAMDIRDGKATGAFNSAHYRARNIVNTLESLTQQQGIACIDDAVMGRSLSPSRLNSYRACMVPVLSGRVGNFRSYHLRTASVGCAGSKNLRSTWLLVRDALSNV